MAPRPVHLSARHIPARSEGTIETTPESDVIITFDHFTAWYDRRRAPVLRDLTFEVRRGEFILLLGASGAGKSTLGLCLNGIVPHVQGATEGDLIVARHRVRDWPVSVLASKVGIIFQDVESQLCMLYVRDEVAFGPENMRVPSEEVEQRVANGDQVVSTTYVTPYQDGCPVLVPGQVFSPEILAFMRSLDTPEIHDYRVSADKALEAASLDGASGLNSRPAAAPETVRAATTSQATSSKAKRRTEAPRSTSA